MIREIVARIQPHDDREARDQAKTLEWIESGAPLNRLQRPNVPPWHLAVYFVMIDPAAAQILLLDHIKAGLWLPPGGHVEEAEDPRDTVEREIIEELGLPASFQTACADLPLFLTNTTTQGTGSHTDVTLWYVVGGDASTPIAYEEREFRGYRWLAYDEVLAMPATQVDPEMHRFVSKLLPNLTALPA